MVDLISRNFLNPEEELGVFLRTIWEISLGGARVRWVSLKNLKPDRVLAQHILDERGRILLAKGVVLRPSLVDKLWKIGIGSVCIEDESTDDIVVREFVNPETRQLVLQETYSALTELASINVSKVIKAPRLKQRMRPLLTDIIAQLKAIDGAGDHLGTVYLSDGELYHHSVNVTFFSISLGLGLGLTEEELIDLGMGTLLHDVGKLRIPEKVLRKPGKLTDEEFELIKLHASYGYEILRVLSDLPARSSLIALEHHERFDGTGYPRGLRGNEIKLFSRIAGVADVYEALTANRVYRTGYLPHQAFELLLGGGGTQFDPTVVNAFVDTIAIYPLGATVILSNGFRCVVTQCKKRQTHRPVVRVIEDESGQRVTAPWDIDLGSELTLQIVGCEA